MPTPIPLQDNMRQPAPLNHREPLPVPYLTSPPEIIDLPAGRQLLVDDYLLERNGFARVFHDPVKHPGNPVMAPVSAEERAPEFPPCAVAKCGGVWYDDADRLFKMWYMTGYLGHAALAVSRDGLHWERPAHDVAPGTNLVLPRDIHPDSGSVVIDYAPAHPGERYKWLLREPDMPQKPENERAHGFVSGDGIHWRSIGRSGKMGDRSTMFYDPLRQRWVQSIRATDPRVGRYRQHFEAATFGESLRWDTETALPWLRADCYDHGKHLPAQLYNFDAIAYESLFIGFFQILHGPPNEVGERVGLPKWTELHLATSRDAFHWHRPHRAPFLPARREYGSWEYGYVESSAGMCLIVGDELWLYYSAYAGDPTRLSQQWQLNGTYGNGAMGLARLRRDGFTSLRPGYAGADATTRPLRFQGGRFFVNANTVGTRLTVAVLDRDHQPLPGFSHDDCEGFLGNATCAEIRWRNRSLREMEGETVRFDFRLDRGDFYAFWTTESPRGKSGGFTAGGGPGLTGGRDT